MDEVGQDYRAGKGLVPEALIAAKSMHTGMDVLRPLLAEGETHGVSAGRYEVSHGIAMGTEWLMRARLEVMLKNVRYSDNLTRSSRVAICPGGWAVP